MGRHTVTVIVPVYDAEKYLNGCLRSLAGQTIRKRELEVLLVNDGSADGSEAVCRRWCEKYRWMRLINRPNGGPSAARNTGIREAKGHYLMYLDADDTLGPDSVRAVRDFFAAHEDEVDLVTYPLVRERGGRRIRRHWRYDCVAKTGVYGCDEKPYFAQVNINVCVRNRGEDNILFEENRSRHEDETYVTANIARRWKFGFVAEAEYRYNKDNDGSIVATSFHAYYLFEDKTAWFEGQFAAHTDNHPNETAVSSGNPGRVPLYLQGLLLNDLEWKLRNGLLFPWHYEGDDFARAESRLQALLRRVDPGMIAGHPQMSKGQKAFWLDFTRREPYGKEELALAIRQYLNETGYMSSPAVRARRQTPPKRRVWLYCDACPSRSSNAALQFQHDLAKADGVRRLFLLRDAKDAALFPPEQRKSLLPRRGVKHILAYLRCEWILSSQLDLAAVSPFAHRKLERLAQRFFLRWRMVYLQDGVHQFAGGGEYFAACGLAEKVVVSAPAELACFQDTYGYRPEQLIPAGLARYDALDRSAPPQGRVLFAPDWRAYLMHDGKPAHTRVQASDYYKNFYAFLNSPALAALLAERNLELDVHLHPSFAALSDLFAVDSPRVHLLEGPPLLARYNACITDISPIAYDFAYLGRYVQYFLPDGPQFRAGMHTARAFDLPQAFGPHAETPDGALAQLRAAALRGFEPQEEYKGRMEGFFYPLENGREKVYQAIMQ